MKEQIIKALQLRAEEAKQYGIPQFVMGLNDAIEIVKQEFEKVEKDLQKCPVCGEEVENGEDGMMEHYTVCEGEQ